MAVTSAPPPRFHLSLDLQDPGAKPSPLPSRRSRPVPTTETLRRRLLRNGVSPTPKILHALRKKEALKALRRARKDTAAVAVAPNEEALDVEDEEVRFRAAAAEYRALLGRPWDGSALGVVAPRVDGLSDGKGLDGLKDMLAARRGDGFRWLLDDDLETEVAHGMRRSPSAGFKADEGYEERRIEWLVTRLNEDDLTFCDWRLTRMMKKADIIYNEDNLLKVLNGLEARGNWRQALSVTQWVYNENIYRHRKSRFVYTKLLSILGKSLKATEALRVFNIMRQWKGVFWVFQQMRTSCLSPTGASFGLAMEVMLKAKKYDFVQKYFEKMHKSGVPPRAITYKVLVRAFWEQGKVNEAVEAVTEMEQRGVVGAASVYYELACCLCNNGRWKDAMLQPYFLEHALDSILEQGEIPDGQMFTEAIFQYIAQRDFGRTLQLLNVMSDASINVSELQWCNILQKNVHLFSMDVLQDLLKYLCTRDKIGANPALSFIRALQSQCGTTSVKGTHLLTDGASIKQGELSLLENTGKPSSSSLAEPDQLTNKNLCSSERLDVEVSHEVPNSDLDIPQRIGSAVMRTDISLCGPLLGNKHEKKCVLGLCGTQGSAIDEVLDLMTSYGDSPYEGIPSASEILEHWEEASRDGA
ncbi:hypothetical protein PR202_ga26066 [Eleusine coracana subsp. coracana]|uniref:PROP1-like PPR domain-containing protein n=1 Tax=Eleusine coracana subsp. coracana TaxID=191504 RepID=A0AAV5DAZ1_ELECO|nr:hypothetical protein PR202_ga26066 [Eleusine coracana subsp. coracana]